MVYYGETMILLFTSVFPGCGVDSLITTPQKISVCLHAQNSATYRKVSSCNGGAG